MNATEKIKSIQSTLGVTADGVFGPKSRAALESLIAAAAEPLHGGDLMDARSEKNIATLHPKVQPYIRKLMAAAKEQSIIIVITSALRTYAEQDALYEQGRTRPGNIVTSARGGYSSHNFALAADFTEFRNGQPVWESANYTTVGKIAESLGLSWGGRWSTPDEPHVYLKPDWAAHVTEGEMMAGLRQRHRDGIDVFT